MKRYLIIVAALLALTGSAHAQQSIPVGPAISQPPAAGGGGGGGGVSSVSGGNGIAVTGTASNPIVNINAPVSAPNGGSGIASPTAHNLMIAEGASPFTLLSCGANLPLIGQGASADPVCQLLNLTNSVTGILPLANGGTQCASPSTVAGLPGSPTQGMLCTVTDSTNDCNSGATVVGSGSHVCAVLYTGSAWQMIGTSAGAVGMVNPMTTLGDIIYGGASGAPTRLAGNVTTTRKFYISVGSGSVAAAPIEGTIQNGDLPTSGVVAGSYTSADITVNAQGIVTAASNTTTGTAFMMGVVTASQILYYPTPIAVTFPATFSSSNTFVSCATNPSESDAYTLKSGGTSLATITVSTSCTLTFSTLAGSHAAAAGEKLEMDAPATVSGNVSFSIQVTR